ncbi:TorD/DmsD family molecular chaperone [Mobilicoccus pelagius]|uniref:Uncharacterized protein n=1 Tax=Mobilicoccus pelagius NBRC 104925 TaxID=1089455 RepID=H5UMY4_9MICO|nr:molecular chaperone TorD family protein [Mobilicoccus pelagius]GAB47092.1 hypothetical protein MOPEL_003_01170 [Mobilicoccus pelagius NBRC 104925]
MSTPLPWPEVGDAVPPAPRPERLDVLAGAATALSRWFLTPPDAAALAALGEPGVLEDWPVPLDDAGRDGLRLLAGPHDAGEVAVDHARLFVGPGHLRAAPYESVHTSEEGLLFEPETLDVRAWYHHYDLAAPREGREPDDHVGLELEFVATLASWAWEALERGDTDAAAVFAEGARGFCETHLGQWGVGFAELAAREARTDFYRGVASLTSGFLLALPHLLEPS